MNGKPKAFNKAIGNTTTSLKVATIENINLEMTTLRAEKDTLYAVETEDKKKDEAD